ncbi:MAG TPA: biosynthetic peptidoglycan transglycosylase [Rhodanobacteraceae bacterium]|nr:biosynthetic peptidoglycan transglycosylase [Rhodanobacteraceae bacterium]
METRSFPKLLNIWSLPFVRVLGFAGARIRDRRLIENVISQELLATKHLSNVFVSALIAAEDKRFFFHAGVDVYAIFRAIAANLSGLSIQGASTVEQQLVRTITGRRERTYSRKLREMCLAAWLSAVYDKSTIAKTYLRVAYYGFGSLGIDKACRQMHIRASAPSVYEAAFLVARIRYPQPQQLTTLRLLQLVQRAEWIARLLEAESCEASSVQPA